MPQWRMRGPYLKDCHCIAFCPCHADSDPEQHNSCQAIIGMRIQEGNFGGTA